MKITVSGKQMDVGASLREHVEGSLDARVSKYFERAIDAEVVFHKEGHLFFADIFVNEGTGKNVVIRGQGREDEIYAAFDKAADRIEKQLRRYKRRLKNHRATEQAPELPAMSKYIISTEEKTESDNNEAPLIIAEKQTALEVLSVSNAVMLMDLAHLPTLMFINEKTGGLDVVYHRNDGNISWVESQCVPVQAGKKAAA